MVLLVQDVEHKIAFKPKGRRSGVLYLQCLMKIVYNQFSRVFLIKISNNTEEYIWNTFLYYLTKI